MPTDPKTIAAAAREIGTKASREIAYSSHFGTIVHGVTERGRDEMWEIVERIATEILQRHFGA